MRGHGCSQFVIACFWLTSLSLVGTQSILAASANPQNPPINPNSSIATLPPEVQGDVLMAHGNYAAAIEAYQHGQLHSAIVWNKMGIAYHHLFALQEAQKDYKMAIFLNPRYADALNNLGAVYHGQHNYKQAERTYKRALKYAPNSAVVYCNLGTTYFIEHKYKQGAKAYQKAMTLDPKVFDPSEMEVVQESSSRDQRIAIDYYLAKMYATAGKNEQALIFLRKALDAGFNNRRQIMEDKEFSQLRTTPEFHKLMVDQHLD